MQVKSGSLIYLIPGNFILSSVPRCHEMLFIVELLREITPFFAGVLKYSLGMKYAVCKHLSLQEMNDGEANQATFLKLS